MDAPVVAALVTAVASLLVALGNFVLTRKAQDQTVKNQQELQRYQRDLRLLESRLAVQRDERDARRDYEYEALKRMYHECSPLLFQMAEQSAQVVSRVENLAFAAGDGNLEGARSWLSAKADRYYLRSSHYRLLASMASVKLLQKRLTHLDLTLDVDLRIAYAIARQAMRSVGDDFEIAKSGREPLSYDPHNESVGTEIPYDERTHYQQGIPRGILENAVEALIVREDDGQRVMTFLEFERELDDKSSALHAAVKRMRYLFEDYHPGTRPVLWRILLVLASLHRAITLWVDRDREAPLPDFGKLLHMPAERRSGFDWQAGAKSALRGEALDVTFSAADAYIARTIERELGEIALSAPLAA